jgi:hypothetical protein
MSIYLEYGYKDRKEYLTSLSENMGISKSIVFTIASILGASEDFDGLISELEDNMINGEY